MGVVAFIIVILYAISKAGEEEKLKELPEETRRKIEMRKENIEFIGMAIVILGAIAIIIWILIVAFSD